MKQHTRTLLPNSRREARSYDTLKREPLSRKWGLLGTPPLGTGSAFPVRHGARFWVARGVHRGTAGVVHTGEPATYLSRNTRALMLSTRLRPLSAVGGPVLRGVDWVFRFNGGTFQRHYLPNTEGSALAGLCPEQIYKSTPVGMAAGISGPSQR
jgi:hypothetical protein